MYPVMLGASVFLDLELQADSCESIHMGGWEPTQILCKSSTYS